MPVVAVANPKGGVGKSTLATNIAGYFAQSGHPTALGDVDSQQSSRLWLQQRPAQARAIDLWEVSAEWLGKPGKGVTHAVLDTPAGMNGWRLRDMLRLADRIIVPLQANLFDIYATGQFLDDLAAHHPGGLAQVAIVGMRVDPRTIAAQKLQAFVDALGLPVLGYLRNTQNYVQLAAQGLSIFDQAPRKAERDVQQWQGICQWVDAIDSAR